MKIEYDHDLLFLSIGSEQNKNKTTKETKKPNLCLHESKDSA